jgi:hypothetical protein
MELIEKGYRSLWLMIDLNADRVIIPLAIIVGLVGGAAIGAELFRLQAPVLQFIH